MAKLSSFCLLPILCFHTHIRVYVSTYVCIWSSNATTVTCNKIDNFKLKLMLQHSMQYSKKVDCKHRPDDVKWLFRRKIRCGLKMFQKLWQLIKGNTTFNVEQLVLTNISIIFIIKINKTKTELFLKTIVN